MGLFGNLKRKTAEGVTSLKKQYDARVEKAKEERAYYKEEYNKAKRQGMLKRARAEGYKAGRTKGGGIGGIIKGLDKELGETFGKPTNKRVKSPFDLDAIGSSDSVWSFGSEPRKRKRRK